MDREKAHFQDADNLPQEAEIHYLLRKEFGIPYREYYHMCFEGSYVPEFIEYALKIIIGRIDQQAEDNWIADDASGLIEEIMFPPIRKTKKTKDEVEQNSSEH